MSGQLKVIVLLLVSIACLGLGSQQQKQQKNYQGPWSKARVPIQIRMTRETISTDTFKYSAEISSNISDLEIHWKLAKSQTLVSGQIIELLGDNKTHSIVVTETNPGDKEVIFARVSPSNNKNITAQNAIKLTPISRERQQKIERIKAHFKAKGVQFIE